MTTATVTALPAAPPSVQTLHQQYLAGRCAVLIRTSQLRQADTAHDPGQRARALDRWLRQYLAGAHAWIPGTAAAVLQGLADGLDEAGQP